MCYHISLTKDEKAIEKHSKAKYNYSNIHKPYFNFDAIKSVFNDNEINKLSIIKQDDPDIIDFAIWQLLPTDFNTSLRHDFWKKSKTLNATSERLFTSPLFSQFIKWQKCIILVDGFYEPHTTNFKEKIPFYIKEKNNNIFALAGIYSEIQSTESLPLYSTTIITKEATSFFKEIHNTPNSKGSYRMPFILDEKNYWDWLHIYDEEEIKNLITKDSEQEFISYPVSNDLYKRKLDTNNKRILNEVSFNKGLF